MANSIIHECAGSSDPRRKDPPWSIRCVSEVYTHHVAQRTALKKKQLGSCQVPDKRKRRLHRLRKYSLISPFLRESYQRWVVSDDRITRPHLSCLIRRRCKLDEDGEETAEGCDAGEQISRVTFFIKRFKKTRRRRHYQAFGSTSVTAANDELKLFVPCLCSLPEDEQAHVRHIPYYRRWCLSHPCFIFFTTPMSCHACQINGICRFGEIMTPSRSLTFVLI